MRFEKNYKKFQMVKSLFGLEGMIFQELKQRPSTVEESELISAVSDLGKIFYAGTIGFLDQINQTNNYYLILPVIGLKAYNTNKQLNEMENIERLIKSSGEKVEDDEVMTDLKENEYNSFKNKVIGIEGVKTGVVMTSAYYLGRFIGAIYQNKN